MYIRVLRSSGKIEKIDFEEYLKGVVPAEITREAPLEAMKAQAIASRTYAYRYIQKYKDRDYDLVDTTAAQVYKPEKRIARSDQAVEETRGIIMTYKGKPIGGHFSSSNRGYTRSGKEKWGGSLEPWSICKLDPFDKHGGGGHSVGMSQRGAMAMDAIGYEYRDILEFYFNASFEYTVLDYSNLPAPKLHGLFKQESWEDSWYRNIKKGTTGKDAKRVKDKLLQLGYLKSSTTNKIGEEASDAIKEFQRDNKLEDDGVVGQITWFKLFPPNYPAPDGKIENTKPVEPEKKEDETVTIQMPTLKKNLKDGSRGDEVKAVQERLNQLGYDAGEADGIFGSKTRKAVKDFQKENKLEVDGIVGKLTLVALFKNKIEEPKKEEENFVITIDIPKNIGSKAAKAIAQDLQNVSEIRRNIVLTALKEAYDPEEPRDYPYSLYIRGGNLYNTDLSLNVIDSQRIETGAKRQPQYYSGGSKQMMLAAVKQYPGQITGADCSGGIVGLLRKFELVKPTFDAIANGLCGSGHSRKISKANLRPGDWVGLSGHIGLYVGGGYVVEWYGQNFGCQLTKLGTKRKAWDFVGKRYRTRAEWTKFRDPKYYD